MGERKVSARLPNGLFFLGIAALVVGVIVAAAGLVPRGSGKAAPPAATLSTGESLVAGVTTLSLPSGPVDVWYPADRAASLGHSRASYDIRSWLPAVLRARAARIPATFSTAAYPGIAPASGKTYPLVLFAHGLYSFRDQSTYLTTWLASHGFVVAAPELPGNDLTSFFGSAPSASGHQPSAYQVLVDTENLLMRVDTEPGSLLHGLIRAGPIGVVGHSLGGLDAVQFATRPEVGTFVALAAGWKNPPGKLPAKRSLFMEGAADHDVKPAWVITTYRDAANPKSLQILPGAGHLVFTDLCMIRRNAGGLLAFGRQLGIHLALGTPFTKRALDGCGAPVATISRDHMVIDRSVLSDLSYLRGSSRPG